LTSQESTRIPELDGLRAIAVTAVVAYHLAPSAVPGGFLGVDLFFVLSGYLITSLLAAEEAYTGRISLRGFYSRRALRILPPLAVAIALALALDVATKRYAAIAVLFGGNLVRPWDARGVAHTWSLAVEEHFYVLWPIAFIALRRWRVSLLVAVIAMAIVLRVLAPLWEISPGWIYQLTPTRGADSLAIGCLAALLPFRGRWPKPSLAALVSCFFFVRMEDYFLLTVGMTVFALISAIAVTGARGPLLRSTLLQVVGKRSYGLYLYHFPIFLWVDRLKVGSWAGMSIKLLLSLAVTEISYRTVERASRSLKARMPQAQWATPSALLSTSTSSG
jgi:peptidoglycan/LPS O-acetylase OafA/YrhL